MRWLVVGARLAKLVSDQWTMSENEVHQMSEWSANS